jgi:hypothetical protein
MANQRLIIFVCPFILCQGQVDICKPLKYLLTYCIFNRLFMKFLHFPLLMFKKLFAKVKFSLERLPDKRPSFFSSGGLPWPK